MYEASQLENLYQSISYEWAHHLVKLSCLLLRKYSIASEPLYYDVLLYIMHVYIL